MLNFKAPSTGACALRATTTGKTLMLNFDEQRFVRIQSGAVSLGGRLHEVIGACLSSGAQNLFFLGSGGAGILMLPAADLLQTRSVFPVFLKIPAEMVALGSVHLGPRSIAVIP